MKYKTLTEGANVLPALEEFAGDSVVRMYLGNWSDYETMMVEKFGRDLTPHRVKYETPKRRDKSVICPPTQADIMSACVFIPLIFYHQKLPTASIVYPFINHRTR